VNIFRVPSNTSYLPTASISILKKRADAFFKIRHFFQLQKVLEVDTPILSSATAADVHLDSIQTKLNLPNLGSNLNYYLHTSPEYAMKRLLCAGSGDIYYLGKVFRQGDLSPRHQPEFTMLEWYRLDYSLQQMMTETARVIQLLLGDLKVEYLSYQQAFKTFANIENIHTASAKNCKQCLEVHNVAEVVGVDENDKNLWEQLVLTEVVEPNLGNNKITCLHNYPAKDAALAQISADKVTAERFEVFVDKMEIANGYLELQGADLYQQRFLANQQQRTVAKKEIMPLDENLLLALAEQGLPSCSGVALGFDRLLMLVEGKGSIEQVLPFSIKNS